MKRIFVIEDLCNGCRTCEAFCSSLTTGVFSEEKGRITVIKTAGEEKDIPVVACDGNCVRPLYGSGRPTCVDLCPTGALYYAEQERGVTMRRDYEAARAEHSLFKIIAPWKWPFPWRRPGAAKAEPPYGEAP